MSRETEDIMKKPDITKDKIKTLLETRFVNVVDIQYEEGKHYYDATRHRPDAVTALKTDEEFKSMTADAVTCVVIVKTPGEEEKLLLLYEYRYPTGQFLLSPPAGLVDGEESLYEAAGREIFEETGIALKETDRIEIINPLVFSSPGLTDECNALVCAMASLPDLSSLTSNNAVGSECFDGFVLLTRQEAERIFRNGRDDRGIFYSVYTWMALSYFLSDRWK